MNLVRLTPNQVRAGAASEVWPLDGFDDFVAFEATGADVGALRGALEQDANPLQVRVPAPLRGDHRVRAMVAERRLLPTDCADLRHCGGQCSGEARFQIAPRYLLLPGAGPEP